MTDEYNEVRMLLTEKLQRYIADCDEECAPFGLLRDADAAHHRLRRVCALLIAQQRRF